VPKSLRWKCNIFPFFSSIWNAANRLTGDVLISKIPMTWYDRTAPVVTRIFFWVLSWSTIRYCCTKWIKCCCKWFRSSDQLPYSVLFVILLLSFSHSFASFVAAGYKRVCGGKEREAAALRPWPCFTKVAKWENIVGG